LEKEKMDKLTGKEKKSYADYTNLYN